MVIALPGKLHQPPSVIYLACYGVRHSVRAAAASPYFFYGLKRVGCFVIDGRHHVGEPANVVDRGVGSHLTQQSIQAIDLALAEGTKVVMVFCEELFRSEVLSSPPFCWSLFGNLVAWFVIFARS